MSYSLPTKKQLTKLEKVAIATLNSIGGKLATFDKDDKEAKKPTLRIPVNVHNYDAVFQNLQDLGVSASANGKGIKNDEDSIGFIIDLMKKMKGNTTMDEALKLVRDESNSNKFIYNEKIQCFEIGYVAVKSLVEKGLTFPGSKDLYNTREPIGFNRN